MEIVNVYEASLFSITSLSILLQIYVIVLIAKVSPTSMKAYSWFLIQNTAWDLLFTIVVGFGLALDVPSPDVTGAFVKGLSRYFGKYGGNITMSVMIFCATGMLISLAECLIYRSMVVRSNEKILHFFLKRQNLIIVNIIALSIALSTAVVCYFSLTKPQDYSKFLLEFPWILENLRSTSTSFVYFDAHSTFTQIFFMSVFALFAVYEIISFVAAWSILRILRENSMYFSAKTYTMHLQLTVLLFGQLLTPVICNVLPICIVLMGMLVGYKLDRWAIQLFILTLAIYAPANSLMTILFVTPYRRFTYATISCRPHKISTGVIEYNVTEGNPTFMLTTFTQSVTVRAFKNNK
ncbi:serpentine type 7TM GPCR chemoreceptor srh domain-containing protein [Ditylenchus destructor]|nr:serpentine type 7TM GPCR chemoreceptor srh domain-containing protein [Ditylenchus destructor]